MAPKWFGFITRAQVCTDIQAKKHRGFCLCAFLVGVTGFEPAASWSRTMRTTKLCHTPIDTKIFYHIHIVLSSGL